MHVRDRLDLLPLRQMVAIEEDAGVAFPRQGLLDWLSRGDRYQILSHGRGGQILAAGEHALAEARVVLLQAYGPLVTFGIPTAHSYVDQHTERLMVPLMFMRIDVPRVHALQAQRMLEERGADVREVELQRGRAVIRTELELAGALGLEQAIGELSDGAAHVLCWLVCYRPATRRARRGAPGEAKTSPECWP